MKLTITAAQGKQFASHLRTHLWSANEILKSRLTELSLVLVNDPEMSRLHMRFMKIPGPTDVLTFPLEFDRRGNATGGEVVICVPEARRRAADLGVEVRHELLLYALHGMLHLCGFDDRTERGYRRMHQMEDMILRQLGVGPVFAPTRGGRSAHRRGKSR